MLVSQKNFKEYEVLIRDDFKGGISVVVLAIEAI